MPVPIKVAHRHGTGTIAGGVSDLVCKCTVSVVDEDRNVIVALIRRGQIHMRIPIEVRNRHRRRPLAHHICGLLALRLRIAVRGMQRIWVRAARELTQFSATRRGRAGVSIGKLEII